MGFRFYRRKRLLPGVTLNLSRSGPSISLGAKGAKVTVGLPDTSLFIPSTLNHRPRHSQNKRTVI